MTQLIPHQTPRPFFWPDIVSELQDLLMDFPEPIYIVGGAVRDAFLHRPIHDLDLAIAGDSLGLARHIANSFNGSYFVLDDERGVGRALLDSPEGRIMVDIARFRGPGLLEDLQDRDFTVNAMAVDLKGDLNLLIDPLDGESDMMTKQIRRCAPHSLSSDPVRALRAIRQSAQLGMRLEAETLRDVRAVIPLLTQSSPERVRDELFKLLSVPRPAAAIRVADAIGILNVILPELIPLHNLQLPPPHIFDGWEHTLSVMENLTGILATISFTRTDNTAATFSFGMIAIQLDRYRKQLHTHATSVWPNERPHRALMMLMALLHDVGKTKETGAKAGDDQAIGGKIAAKRTESMRLSNAERTRVTTIIQNQSLADTSDLIAIHRFWRKLGDAGIDVCLLALADHLGTYGPQLAQDNWLMLVEQVRILLEAYFEKHDQLISPPTLLDGNQLVSRLSLKPGPIIGQLLDAIREAQVLGQIETVEEALNLARSFLNNQ